MLGLALCWTCALACTPREQPAPPPPPEASPVAPSSPERVYAPRPARSSPAPTWVAHPAFASDRDYDSDDVVQARRLVYRVTLRVPASLGERTDAVPSPTAELHVDVSEDRLRARFVGDEWPVPARSEVRLRRDQPGVYIFDDEGGRSLGPGQLARWFEGGRLRREPGHRVQSPPSSERRGPGALVCRLVAEWAQAPPDHVARRCGAGGSPPSFRVGLWRAERTADVGMELPRRALRADHLDAPEPSSREHYRAFLPPELLARLPQGPRWRTEPSELETEASPDEGLVVRNRAENRIIVTVRGTPIGFVDAEAEAHFIGLPQGTYRVGAMRPFGLQAARARATQVPGRIELPRWIR